MSVIFQIIVVLRKCYLVLCAQHTVRSRNTYALTLAALRAPRLAGEYSQSTRSTIIAYSSAHVINVEDHAACSFPEKKKN